MRENEIPCEVCLDLIPLVRDGVASDGSRTLVLHHTENCESCRAALDALPPEAVPLDPVKPGPDAFPADDRRILRRLRRSVLVAGLSLLAAGVLTGVFFTNTQNLFYNLLIMPAAGGLGVLTLRKRWWLLPPGVFVLSFAGLLAVGLMEGYTDAAYLFSMPLSLSLIYTALTLPGMTAAALLRFAFKKEALS